MRFIISAALAALLGVSTVATVATAAPFMVAQASQKTLRVTLKTLYCHKTTEKGHDEFYMMVGAKNGNGTEVNYLKPGAGGDADNGHAWDMNDSGDKRDRSLRTIIYQEPLADGQSADIRMTFLESDSTDYTQAAGVASSLLTATGDPYAIAVASGLTIASKFNAFKNKDDYLGSLALLVRNNNGVPDWQYGFAPGGGSKPPYAKNSKEDGENSGGANNMIYVNPRIPGGTGEYSAYLLVQLI